MVVVVSSGECELWLNSDLVVLSTGFLRCICMRFDEVINLTMFIFQRTLQFICIKEGTQIV